MVLHGHVLCWNEIELVPFVMDYWKRAGVDKLFVYDNGSTDGTLEELAKYDFVQVVPFESNGYTDEYKLTELRNTLWKSSRGDADWVIISDFDEVPYYYGEGTLKEWLETQHSAIKTKMPQLLCDIFPDYNGTLIHKTEGMRAFEDANMNKTLTFPLNGLCDISFELGAHKCHPRGIGVSVFPNNYCFLHLKHLGKKYVIEKSQRIYDNLRPDIRMGNLIDNHYIRYIKNYDTIFEDFKNRSYEIKI